MQTVQRAAVSASSLRLAMRAVRETTIDTARNLGVPIVDVERAADGRLEYFMDDFHLNADGNAVAARAFVDVLRPILDELQTSHALSEPQAPVPCSAIESRALAGVVGASRAAERSRP